MKILNIIKDLWEENKKIIFMILGWIIIMIYSIKLSILQFANPEMTVKEYRWYIFIHWQEYLPMWISFIYIISIWLYIKIKR